jgi:2-oxoglutarate ferredoxin oxidoreductase subunit delta
LTFFIKINSEFCKGCGLCAAVCPANVMKQGEEVNAKGWQYYVTIPESTCTGCKKCALICPDVAITVFKEK